ncbi:MAG: type II methionyl aminopeptidase [Nitrososphaerota archaeon]|jgi:methionyl aminopeptidase|nr:type II methionyl aminopeptidase [Nitrososphaerota archaeon]MDG6926947.1 type II methionyl aminopeptidase [Nitrososphaerota archaeon]MDG6930501.1 type II methionyl aminopeptidase [Nitrososphaerota archaeon]MDG6932176.1 type II methionyl aminopeptidase [Nitrososphaerota archaeon]MDG6935554.1 type II methionyl aminopeptidase [Nitrososphaerota archaeon]
MINEVLESYKKAGNIAAGALKRAEDTVHEGQKVIDICEDLEGYIIKQGGFPAFPVNISQNEEAAHYTAKPDDDKKIAKDSIVKIDLGVHINGYIADTAITINFSPAYEGMKIANHETILQAIDRIHSGMSFEEFGGMVQKLARSYGFKPIENLMGHGVDHYNLHANVSIPMVETRARGSFIEGNAYAIEPFFVDGNASGYVIDAAHSNIYRLPSARAMKERAHADILKYIWENYVTLPFALRWIYRQFGESATNAINELEKRGIIEGYMTLVESSRSYVSQYEHTIVINGGKALITSIKQ